MLRVLIILIVLVAIAPTLSLAQIDKQSISSFQSTSIWTELTADEQEDFTKYLEAVNFQLLWFSHPDSRREIMLRSLMEQPEFMVVNRFRPWLDSMCSQQLYFPTRQDTIAAELKLTSISLKVLRRLLGGVPPKLSYSGLEYQSRTQLLPGILAKCIKEGTLSTQLNLWNKYPNEISSILARLQIFTEKLRDPSFTNAKVTSTLVTASNSGLVLALFNLGIISRQKDLHDSVVRNGLKDAQRLFEHYPDGKIKVATLKELNIPLEVRYQQLMYSLGMYRWLADVVSESRIVVVNIPAAMLSVYDKNEVSLSMRMVVGDPITPTPTLSSRITEVVLYPYWMVPNSIATKELLTYIKKDVGFLQRHNLQVINKQGRIVDPYKLEWSKFSSSNFPYILRQSTGCDNALGLLKLNFYNPFSVYLHDTPYKSNFLLAKRFYSHGCMRMEKPMELGRMLLGFNRIAIDTLEDKGCLTNQKPIVVKVQHQLPVVVWHNPVSLDGAGRLVFHYDIYRRFHWEADEIIPVSR